MKRNWEEKITHTLDQIEPSQQQTHQMWTAILQSKSFRYFALQQWECVYWF